MPVTGYDTASKDLGRRSMMAMKDGSAGAAGIPAEAFGALTERVRILEDRLDAAPTKAELQRAMVRAIAIGGVIGAVVGAALAVMISRVVG